MNRRRSIYDGADSPSVSELLLLALLDEPARAEMPLGVRYPAFEGSTGIMMLHLSLRVRLGMREREVDLEIV